MIHSKWDEKEKLFICHHYHAQIPSRQSSREIFILLIHQTRKQRGGKKQTPPTNQPKHSDILKSDRHFYPYSMQTKKQLQNKSQFCNTAQEKKEEGQWIGAFGKLLHSSSAKDSLRNH